MKNWILWKGSECEKVLWSLGYQEAIFSYAYFASVSHGDNLWRIFFRRELLCVQCEQIRLRFSIKQAIFFYWSRRNCTRRKFFFVVDDWNLTIDLRASSYNLITTTWYSTLVLIFFQLSYCFFFFFFLSYMITSMYNSSKWKGDDRLEPITSQLVAK